SNPGLVPNPTVSYASPAATGTLTFTPLADQFGTSTISVVVKDDGGTANGGIDSITNTFTVTVLSVNDAPTLNALADIIINVNAGLQTVPLNGISAGAANEATQTISITATSSAPAIVPNPSISYSSPNTTGTLTFTPVSNASGNATVTVYAKDNGGTANGG